MPTRLSRCHCSIPALAATSDGMTSVAIETHTGIDDPAQTTWTPETPISKPADLKARATHEALIDSEEAARFLNINPKTLQKMARNSEVPAYRIGKLWKFRIPDLDEWLRSKVFSSCHSCRENERR